MAKIIIKVDTYSGYKADERPVSFTLGEKVFGIDEVLDSWYGEDHEYFKVRASDNATYIIRHDIAADEWELVMMEAGKEGG